MSRIVMLLLGVLLLPGVGYADEKAPKDAPAKDATATDNNAQRDFDKQWNFADPAETEKTFRQMLKDHSTEDGEPDLHYVGELLSQIARALGLQRKFDEAHRELDRAEALLAGTQGLAGTRGVSWARIYLERGRAFNSAGDSEQASELFKKALKEAQEAKADYYAVDAAHMLGISEPPEQAHEWNLKAIELAEASKHPRTRRWLGALYNNTGWTYFEKNDYQAALDLFRKNAAYRKELKADDRWARYCIGKALRMLKKYDEALKIQREVEKEREKDPDGFVFEELGELLWAKGDKDAAKPYFVKAHELLSKISWVKSQTERMESIRERAGLPKPKEPAKDDATDGI